MIQRIRSGALVGCVIGAIATLGLALISPWWLLLELLFVPLAIVGIYDYTQPRHSILRNYPIIGHLRFIVEDMGPELHQYLVENSEDGRPFNRDTRSLIYQRAKGVADEKAFGTELDVYENGYTWMAHSIAPKPRVADPVADLRITVGGEQCAQPYSLSVLNISAMSFGALGRQAVRAMNLGAKNGGFAHVTGEGGLSKYHLEHGGDLIWQIGTGYFGCRTTDGEFSPELFAKNAAHEQVKMIEIKVSQGAKPGHGGILPGAKVTEEIAEARLVEPGKDVFSPTYHKAFSTPLEMTAFIAQLRELSNGKPVGFKLCIGDPREFMAIVKAMIASDTYPDFIVVDGGEGGTGAAPLEFSDSLGFPLVEGLMVVQNILVGAGVRDRMKVGASGKMVTASAITQSMALGADWCNSARAFMFAVGCIQSQRCHTNQCPVGVTTQDPRLQRALVVPDKSKRVEQFHHNTVQALAEMIAAMGLDHTSQLSYDHVIRRVSQYEVRTFGEIHKPFEPGELLDGTAPDRFQFAWDNASPDVFRPAVGRVSR
ncbi:FMN-binding glutamate synthase family protein [Aquihabitans sp. McL0605]|uniref:FMN-binding glutamate synthase family protein n=1 Tax=Aquihabitans sp. McL0605 TaxID=3415671 RepID=UPI003CEAD763